MTPQAQHFSFSDCDGFAELLKHDDAEITRLRAGGGINTLSLVPLDQMMFRYGTRTTPWIASGTAAQGHVSVLMDLNYQTLPLVNGLRQEGLPLLQLYGGGAEHYSVASDPGEYTVIPIPESHLNNALHGLGLNPGPVKDGCLNALRLGTDAFQLLNGTFQSLRAIAERWPDLVLSDKVRRTAQRELLTRLALAIGQAEPSPENRVKYDRMKTLRRAREFLQAKAHTPVYLAELCTAVGVPERTLREIFQTLLGVSPLRFLQLRRMRQARATLQQADKDTHSVKSIALDNGFWELGRFAVEYKGLFGESPSETLAATSR
jgi:AraC-like DNA-binding protein